MNGVSSWIEWNSRNGEMVKLLLDWQHLPAAGGKFKHFGVHI